MPEDLKKKKEEEVDRLLLSILLHCKKEDEYSRNLMLREARLNDLYWHGFQFIFWDQSINDYRIPTHDVMDSISSREETKFVYDYVVNVFKAHGLSIIAALSADVPGVPFAPFDSNNIEDVRAAKKAEELGKVIGRLNKTKLIFYQALFTLYTSHFCVAYNYYERDKKYGTVDVPRFELQDTKVSPDKLICPDCGYEEEFQEAPDNTAICPQCGGKLELEEGETQKLPTQVGIDKVNKGVEKISIGGTLNYKIPIYAADQDACGYVLKFSDQHYSLLRTLYHEIRDKIKAGGTEDFERLARMQTIGKASDNSNTSLITLEQAWIRPWMFNLLNTEEEAAVLLELYPDGVYFAAVEGVIADKRAESLDAHITITKGDLSRAVHGDPLGRPLVPLQDLENSMMNLMVESVEHSIPSTFADPDILDFESYSRQEVLPGAVYPAKTPINSQKRLGDYFYELKTSSLPSEAVNFGGIIESKSQFVVGAFPSIFGGPQTEGSKTLGEYQESRSYALQRLSIPYQLLYFWWADLVHKCVVDYIKNMLEDEHHAVKTSDGQFQNQSILMEDFASGRFQLLLPESSVELPVSFAQKRSTLSSIIQLNNDLFNQYLFSPENRRVTLRFLGIEELSDLDSNQADKQLIEIQSLMMQEPLNDITPSVSIESEIDDDEIHLRIIRNYLCSSAGQDLKRNNPAGYMNNLLHGKMHQQNLLLKMKAENPETNKSGNELSQEKEVKSNQNGNGAK